MHSRCEERMVHVCMKQCELGDCDGSSGGELVVVAEQPLVGGGREVDGGGGEDGERRLEARASQTEGVRGSSRRMWAASSSATLRSWSLGRRELPSLTTSEILPANSRGDAADRQHQKDERRGADHRVGVVVDDERRECRTQHNASIDNAKTNP